MVLHCLNMWYVQNYYINFEYFILSCAIFDMCSIGIVVCYKITWCVAAVAPSRLLHFSVLSTPSLKWLRHLKTEKRNSFERLVLGHWHFTVGHGLLVFENCLSFSQSRSSWPWFTQHLSCLLKRVYWLTSTVPKHHLVISSSSVFFFKSWWNYLALLWEKQLTKNAN